MLGSEILEIAIGIVFTFLLLSLMASTVRESAEALLKTRAIQLERGLRQMLDDPAGVGVTKQLFDHPLLYGLFQGSYDPKAQLRNFVFPRKTRTLAADGSPITSTQQRVPFHSNLPAYIPSRNFAMALLDLASKQGGGAALSLDAVRQTAITLQNKRLQSALLVAIGEAEGDIDRARTSLEAWFDGTMDRVSGWYKRETQWVLLAIGLVLAVALNVDCLHVARSLALNNTLRETIVQTVEAKDRLGPAASTDQADAAGNPAHAIPPDEVDADLSGLSDIIGWPQFETSVDSQAAEDAACAGGRNPGHWWAIWWLHLLKAIPGWLISAFAVSLGAPFWFDVLNKLMVVRSTVKPYEKSPSEGSGDRDGGVASARLLAPHTVTRLDAAATTATQPEAEDVTVSIRLAIDAGDVPPDEVELLVDGQPRAIPPDNLVEIDIVANVPHMLVARASAGGRILEWSRSITPDLDDDGWPMLATLETGAGA